MKQKFTKFIQSSYGKVAAGLFIASCSSVPVFATTPAIESIETSLTQIVTDVTTTMGTVAPLAVGIFGAFFCWRKAVQFFKSVST